jgi:uncharacterized membrane protein
MNQKSYELTAREMRKSEILIAYVLRFGVIISGIVIAAGMILSWVKTDQVREATPMAQLLEGQLTPPLNAPLTFSDFVSKLSAFDPTAVTALGLILLILLPVCRVALTVGFFAVERDYTYLAITLFVLAVLLSGIIFGKAL